MQPRALRAPRAYQTCMVRARLPVRPSPPCHHHHAPHAFPPLVCASPVVAAAANVAATAAQQAMGQHGQKYVGLLQRWLNIEKLRFYFEVNNQYVMDKLLLVLFAPLLHFGADTIRMPKFKFPEDYQVDSDAARQPPKYEPRAGPSTPLEH
jgi:hypothetical protein